MEKLFVIAPRLIKVARSDPAAGKSPRSDDCSSDLIG